MNLTISKLYPEIPFGHRQPKHSGCCKFGHGHGWSIKVTFECASLDENGFIIDFGRLKFLKDWIDRNLDHAFLICEDDPARPDFEAMAAKGLFKLCVVPDCSAEGLAAQFFTVFNQMVIEETSSRVWVCQVEVFEDSRNSATYRK